MKPNGFVFYRGPSRLDGKPIVAILTGINKRSANSKTGKGLTVHGNGKARHFAEAVQ